MHHKIRYYNKAFHDLRIKNVHIVPLAKGIWHVSCALSNCFEIDGHGGSSTGNDWKKSSTSVYFRNDSSLGSFHGMMAELTFYPDTLEEANFSLFVDGMSKRTYNGVLVSSKCFSKKWDEYCQRKKS
jgi:hypothetical protein